MIIAKVYDEDDEDEDAQKTEKTNSKKIYGTAVFCVCCLKAFSFFGIVITFAQFFIPFVICIDLKNTKTMAVYMIFACSIAAAIMTVVTIVLSTKLPALLILFILTLFLTSGSVILEFFIFSNSMIVIGGVLLVLGYCSALPAIFNCMIERIKITDALNSMLMFVTTLPGTLGITLLIGFQIETEPMMFSHVMLFFTVIIVFSCICLALLDYFERKRGNSDRSTTFDEYAIRKQSTAENMF
ncbi:hypothetical protein B4U79_17775 [Dinothrombium tinctorium]|uniref:Uncharacterized protein n=1 Tax=Dinothrombium tinctorium TaxID=1965070 RepID=A0A3S3NSK5_9ACAR|nr:hypothetical protein B4U79_16162 [Dinothrombium tinctorium]RWS07113.1 hypothetical protein B4U79_16155 [Dinothrombium tinctorium]RWS07553.1 hypothetical protein B4U79_16130 [Dinothrombium tinctorium]RWS08395.1 hypothetical protein B4U79_17775 [Dinothrombium tinctorium]